MLHLDDEHHQNQNPSSRLGLHHHHHHKDHAPDSAFHNNLMDLTLGNSTTTTAKNDNKEGELEENGCTNNIEIEKEHMFDKVVTPSDVGKLNRLVIPKQHAERYFPLDSSSTISSSSSNNNNNNNNVNLNSTNTQKGLLLNFEDCNGKLWRFRYSYWNSSQSYVMTKGWSRFVKDKSLDAGDIVSFHRGLRDSHRHRLYIDCRRRTHHHPPPSSSLLTPFFVPNNQYSVRWAGRLYSLPPAATPQQPQAVNYQNYPFQLVQQQQQQRQQLVQYQQVYGGGGFSDNNLGSGPSVYGLPGDRRETAVAPMIIDSVPVAHHGRSSSNSGGGGGDGNNGKKLRLFGVNMEYCCSSSSSPSINNDNSPAAINMANSNLREELEEEEEMEEEESSSLGRFGDQKGETSVLFDLSPSFQYRPSSS